MTTLAARFREIEITFDEPPPLPTPWPPAWLGPTQSAAVLRFVDSQFNTDSTPAEIRRAFPAARAVSFNPMPLRAIFVSLAKSNRKAA
jgi:ABC-2 type transport system ATP-binding protein